MDAAACSSMYYGSPEQPAVISGQVFDQNGYPIAQPMPIVQPMSGIPMAAPQEFVGPAITEPMGGPQTICQAVEPDSSPSKTETTEDDSSGTPWAQEVELNAHGGLCRLFWYLTLKDGYAIPENKDNQESLDFMTCCVLRWTFFPMIFQTFFLVYIAKFCFDDFPLDYQVHDGWARLTSVAAVAIHIWSMVNFFFNEILRQHRIIRGASDIMRCRSKLICYVLYIWEITIFVAMVFLGSCFLAKSETTIDAILNALGLEFILTIDNYVAEFTVVTGGIQTAYVPKKTVLPESNMDWLGCSRLFVCISLNVIFTPILPILAGWGACLLMDKGFVELGDDDIPIDAVICAVLVFFMLLISHNFITCICCCCGHGKGDESSSEENLYTVKGALRKNEDAQL